MGIEMKVAIIIAPEGFRDEEFFVPYEYFKKNGHEVDVFSTRTGTATGKLGGSFEVEKKIDEMNVENYDAIVFIGGPGTPIVRSYEPVYNKIKKAMELGKVIGAICWSPTIIAKAGALKGKKATVWYGMDPEYGKTTDKVIEEYGASYTGNNVEVDGKIITANGPHAALDYAKAIEKAVEENS